MALPVSTTPNAMAYATGLLENRQLLQIGALISGIGLVASYYWQCCFGKLDSSSIFPSCACQSSVDAVFKVFKKDL